MHQGCSVHARDRNNQSPLVCAIEAGHEEVIKVLVECGAHLTAKGEGEKLNDIELFF